MQVDEALPLNCRSSDDKFRGCQPIQQTAEVSS